LQREVLNNRFGHIPKNIKSTVTQLFKWVQKQIEFHRFYQIRCYKINDFPSGMSLIFIIGHHLKKLTY
jgi:hypothetical protein